MKALLLILTLLAASPAALADGPWKRLFQDVTLPTQEVMEHYSWSNPAAGSATALGSSIAILSTGATTILSSSLTGSGVNAVARNVTLTPTGTTANVAAGTAVVSGKNVNGQSISENFTISSTQSTATTGAKAFKSISSIVFPQASGSGVTLSVGTGNKLGVNRCLNNAGDYMFSEFGGVYDATRGTMAVNASAAESNTFSPNSTPDGSHNIDLFYVQNFRCF